VKGEDESLEREVYETIAEVSEGLPRNALQILDQVLGVDPEKRLSVAKKATVNQATALELFQALLKGAPWKKVSNLLTTLQETEPDAEKVRRAALGYFAAVLLKEDNERAALIIDEFTEPTYETGWPGFIFACYKANK
jgi:DNA polymerase III gamma/tau subunit